MPPEMFVLIARSYSAISKSNASKPRLAVPHARSLTSTSSLCSSSIWTGFGDVCLAGCALNFQPKHSRRITMCKPRRASECWQINSDKRSPSPSLPGRCPCMSRSPTTARCPTQIQRLAVEHLQLCLTDLDRLSMIELLHTKIFR